MTHNQHLRPEKIKELLDEYEALEQEMRETPEYRLYLFKKKKNLPLPEYKDLWSDIAFKKPSSDGGKLTHAVKLAVMQAVNEGRALPEFADVILAVLDMNFVQQYADFDPKSRVMSFATQWPAKLEGNISLESKSGATDPTKGGFSFKLSRTEPKTNLAEPNELGVEEPDQTTVSKKDFAKNAEKIALGHREKPKNGLASKSTMGDVGRKLRKV